MSSSEHSRPISGPDYDVLTKAARQAPTTVTVESRLLDDMIASSGLGRVRSVRLHSRLSGHSPPLSSDSRRPRFGTLADISDVEEFFGGEPLCVGPRSELAP